MSKETTTQDSRLQAQRGILELIKEYKNELEWYMEFERDVRKERATIHQKRLPEMYREWKEAGIDEQVIRTWLDELRRRMDRDLDLALTIIRADMQILLQDVSDTKPPEPA